MVIAYTPGKFEYVAQEDRDKEPALQTVFELKGLSSGETAQIEDQLEIETVIGTAKKGEKNPTKIGLKAGTWSVSYLRIGLKGWRNMKDAAGNEVKFVEGTGAFANLCVDENIDRLSPNLRHELAKAIEDGSKVSEDDAKNS